MVLTHAPQGSVRGRRGGRRLHRRHLARCDSSRRARRRARARPAAPAAVSAHAAARRSARQARSAATCCVRLAHRVTESKAAEALFHSALLVRGAAARRRPRRWWSRAAAADGAAAAVYCYGQLRAGRRCHRIFPDARRSRVRRARRRHHRQYLQRRQRESGQLYLTYKPSNIQQTLAIGRLAVRTQSRQGLRGAPECRCWSSCASRTPAPGGHGRHRSRPLRGGLAKLQQAPGQDPATSPTSSTHEPARRGAGRS